jgi:hypothetical protein
MEPNPRKKVHFMSETRSLISAFRRRPVAMG